VSIGAYAKAIASIIVAAVTVLATALTDNLVTQDEVVTVGIAGVTAVGVYLVPNLESTSIGGYLKGIVAFLGAALVALQSAMTDGGVATSEWLMILVMGLGAVGVVIVPNQEIER
jgi:hypothetical protein